MKPRQSLMSLAGGGLAALLMAGCGGGSGTKPSSTATQASTSATTSSGTTTTETTSTSSTATAERFTLSSPAITTAGAPKIIPARYTCDGADTSLPLTWRNVPAGTKELVLLVVSAGPKGTVPHWAVANLKPSLTGIAAGNVPSGAVLAREKYSICPPKGTTTQYGVALYALKHRIAARPGFSTLGLAKRVAEDPTARIALLVLTYARH